MAALETGSAILTAMYQNKREEARTLAAVAPTLTVWEAAALGENERLRTILDENPPLANAFAPDGHTPLGLAAFFAEASAVRLLLARGADPGLAARNDMKVQPLHAAVAARNREAVEALLARGADPNATQQVGYTPLMGAAGSGKQELVDLLLAHGASLTPTDDHGKTAADIAFDHGHATLAEKLRG